MKPGAKDPRYDGELVVELPHDPLFVQKIRNYLQMNALVIPHTGSLPVLSRVLLRLGDDHLPAHVTLLVEIVRETPDELDLQILEFSNEERPKMEELLTDLQKPAAPKRATRTTVPKEGTLIFDFPSALLRHHHEAEGSAKDESIFGLIFHLASDHFTGRLVVTGEDKSVSRIFFMDGQVVGADQNPMDEYHSYGYLLRKAGKITEGIYQDLRRLRAETHKRDDEILADKIPESVVQMVAPKVIHYVLGRVSTQKTIQYRLEEGAQNLEGVKLVAILLRKAIFHSMEEATQSYRSEELLHGLEPHFNHFVVRCEPPPMNIADLYLTPDEQRFWDVTLGKPIRLRGLFAVSALSKSQSLRALYAFYFLGFIDFDSHLDIDDSEVVEHLKKTLLEMEEMNHFDVLQVHWTSLRSAIQSTYERSRKIWENLKIPPNKKSEAEPLLRKILAKIRESYAYLENDDRRRAYRDKLVEPHKREFTADLFAEHTKGHLFRGNLKEAKLYAEMAIDLCPQKRELRQLLQNRPEKDTQSS